MISYLIKVSRPRFWCYLAGPFLVGMVYGISQLEQLLSWSVMMQLLFWLVPANLILYGINDLFDQVTDRLNPKKSDQEVGLKPEHRRVLIWSIVIFSIIGAWIYQKQLGWYLIWLGLSIGYSVPPWRFKTRPLIDSLSNVLYLIPGVLGYQIASGQTPPVAVFVGGGAWCLAMHAYSAIPDIIPDRAAGIKTIAVVWGRQRTLEFCLLMWAIAAWTAFQLNHWLLVVVIYPVIAMILLIRPQLSVERIYWFFPYLNLAIGFWMVFSRLVILR